MPPLPTFSAYHDALMAKLDELNTTMQGITTAVQANTAAVQALQGTPGKTMQDIWDKIDNSTADLTTVEASLASIDATLTALTSTTVDPGYAQVQDIVDLLKILMNTTGHVDYYNLFEMTAAITGQTVVDGVEATSYPATLEGIILKMQNLQGTPTGSREGLIDNRTDLRNIFDAIANPPIEGVEDPIDWWRDVADIIDLVSDGIDIANDVYDFVRRTVNTASNVATTGTTGATAIGQWLTAMALALISVQMANAQGTRKEIRDNTNLIQIIVSDTSQPGYSNLEDIVTLLGFIRDHTGVVPIIAADSSQPGYTNLHDLLAASGTDVSGLQTTLDFILSELNFLMAFPQRSDRVDLRDILIALECICPWLKKIEANTEELVIATETVVDPLPIDPDTSAPGSRHCERTFWLMSKLVVILQQLQGSYQRLTSDQVRSLYENGSLNVKIKDSDARAIASFGNYVLDRNEDAGPGLDRFDHIINVLKDEPGLYTRYALQNAVYSATSAGQALTNWQDVAQNVIGDTDSGYPHLYAEEKSFLGVLVFPSLLNELFAGRIPRDDSVLDAYSSDCSGIGDSPGGGGLDPSYCASSETGLCGRKHIGSYRYAITFISAHAAWNATRTTCTSNNYWCANCGSHNWDDHGWLTSPDMNGWRVRVSDGWSDIQANGLTVFWLDNPQSDADVEAAAAANVITDVETTISASTSRFSVAIKYPDTWQVSPWSAVVTICPPD